MQLKINGIEFGDNSKYQIVAPLSGLDQPPIRMGAGEWAGRDGGYVSAQFYGTRVIVVNGFFKGTSCEDGDNLRKNLIAALPIRQSLPFFVTTFGGRHLFSQTYIKDFKMDITEGGILGKFMITLVAPDPLLYEAGDGVDPDSGWQEAPVYKLVGGGYVTQYDMPVQWTPGTTPTIVTNAGDVIINPQIVYNGIVTNPIITNVTTNKFVRINITTTQPTDQLIIDMDKRTVTLNGGSVLSYRTLDSIWWGLNPGNNTISFTSSGGSDINFATVRWRNGYKGV
jgi:hypothetical protein